MRYLIANTKTLVLKVLIGIGLITLCSIPQLSFLLFQATPPHLEVHSHKHIIPHQNDTFYVANHTDFGLITASLDGQKVKEYTYTLHNKGRENLHISALELKNYSEYPFYQISQAPDTLIAPGDSSSLKIALHASAGGSAVGEMFIHSNDPKLPKYYFMFVGQIMPKQP